MFVGKGGVGKTTVSAAYAVHIATRNPTKRVLLLSTDPAHSLADVFEKTRNRGAPTPIEGVGKLWIWEVNAQKQFQSFVSQRRKEILNILESGSIFTREEIEPFLDATLPGIAEMAALLAIHDAVTDKQHSTVVVDTAPFGHTLRLFEMPETFQRFVTFLKIAASRDRVLAEHFGGTSELVGARLLKDWQKTVDVLLAALHQAKIFLVATPEKFALNESLRCNAILQNQKVPLTITSLVLNRAVLKGGACRVCGKRATATKSARTILKKNFPKAELLVGEDIGVPVLGAKALRGFGDHVFLGRKPTWKAAALRASEVQLSRASWPPLQTPLSLVLGKGGVGKTTVSAALGFHTRECSKQRVDICSIDPAPSLDDVFQTEIGDDPRAVFGDKNLRASEMDSASIFRKWANRMEDLVEESMTSDQSSIHIDLWFERQLFVQLLESMPPGLDEILAVFRILDLMEDRSKRVVIDMAPTGHALELLATPERILGWTRLLLKSLASHRKLALVQDVAVQVAGLARRVRALAELIQKPESTSIYSVMLAEPLPDRETERLLNDLRSLKLSARMLFVNRVLFAADAKKCRRCNRAREWQLGTLARLKARHPGLEIFVIRNFPSEIAGKNSLRSFTSELWQLA